MNLSRAFLIAAVDGPARAAGGNGITSSIYLAAVGGTLSAVATDLSVYASRTVPVEGDLEPVCVAAKKLAEVAKALPDGPVTLKRDGSMLVVAAGRSRTKLPTSNADEFPALPTVAPTATITVDGLGAALRLVRFAASNDDTRLALCSVRFRGTAGGLTLEATDGHRASRTAVAVSDCPTFEALVPAEAVDRATLDGLVTIEIASAFVRFATPDAALTCRQIDAEYPNIDAVIPKSSTVELRIGAGDLASAVKRVSVVASDRARGLRLSRDADSATLDVRASSTEHGEAGDGVTILGTSEGPAVDVGVNARYLGEALSAVGNGVATIGFGSTESPIVITSEDMPAFLHVCMPMRL